MKKITISIENEFDFDLIKLLLNRVNLEFEVNEFINENTTILNTHIVDQIEKEENKSMVKSEQIKGFKPSTFKTDFKFDFSYETKDLVIRTIKLIQKNYFNTGLKRHIIPMTLKDISDVIEKDLSTVSRIIESKTYFINDQEFQFKDLFSSHNYSTFDGRPVSKFEIMDAIESIIYDENKLKPLTDEAITEELVQKRRYNIKRRTVAKYREQLSIPNSNQRK